MQAYEQQEAECFNGETLQTETRIVDVKLETRYNGADPKGRPLVKCAECGYVFPKSAMTRVGGKDYCRVNGCAQDALLERSRR